MEANTNTPRPDPRPGTCRCRLLAVFALLPLALGGCHGGHPPERPPSILFSPNGEPLSGGPLGHPKCEDAISAWFNRVDGNHDGIVDRDEFLADARTQFDRMDLHHDGYVTAAELSEFRAPYEPQLDADAPLPPDTADQPEGRRRRNGGRPAAMNGADVDTRADPVMSADTTLSFKVSLEDFLTHAGGVFAGLDSRHDGRLDRGEVLTVCPSTQKK